MASVAAFNMFSADFEDWSSLVNVRAGSDTGSASVVLTPRLDELSVGGDVR